MSWLKSSHRLRLPFGVSPVNTATGCHLLSASAVGKLPVASPEVLFPSSVSLAIRSHLVPTVPKPSVMFRPRGFAPPRRFAPPIASRAYSIPVPLMGFSLRGFAPPLMLYLLSEASSLMSLFRLQGIHTRRIPPKVSGLTEGLLRIPPWVFLLRGLRLPRLHPPAGGSDPLMCFVDLVAS